eukprot:COSAG01_NODE_72841_length_252_cov_0.352941_1_plen_27_part_10
MAMMTWSIAVAVAVVPVAETVAVATTE